MVEVSSVVVKKVLSDASDLMEVIGKAKLMSEIQENLKYYKIIQKEESK